MHIDHITIRTDKLDESIVFFVPDPNGVQIQFEEQ